MRVAFVSCICTPVFRNQPVWDQIAQQQPDHLVLLGDSIYLDINAPRDPRDMEDLEFAQHLFTLYRQLLSQGQFSRLVRQLPPGRVHSIWDDHDFLWNDALGAEARADPVQRDKVTRATAFQEAFRFTLANALADGSFPPGHDDPAFWPAKPRPLGTPSIPLDQNAWLHLADVRSFRTRTFLLSEAKRTLLGSAQRKGIATKVQAAPDAVHLFASGSTMAGWKRYARDLQWLMDLASQQRMLVLSGDIHRNEVDAFHTGGLPLHEATSSGAAVKDAVVIGDQQQNYGLLDIAADTVSVRMFSFGNEQASLARTYDRRTWLPV